MLSRDEFGELISQGIDTDITRRRVADRSRNSGSGQRR
jgi:hypothetical protein